MRYWRMTSPRTALLAGFCVFAMASGCTADLRHIEVDGRNRDYLLHVPAGYDGAEPLPLVLALHQFTDTGRGMRRLTGFDAIADEEGFFVAYPYGIRRGWNSGRSGGGPDDVAFLLALIDALRAEFAIDPARIYATGASAGGMMAQFLACQTSVLAAIAPVMGSLNAAQAEACGGPGLPVLLIHGTADPVVPYEGGETFAGPGMRPVFLSAEENIAFWAERGGCGESPLIEPLPPIDESDSARVVRWTYPDCAPGTAAVFYSIEGGGHTWPGGANRYPRFIVGPATRNLDASRVIWEFFKIHARAAE